RAGGALVVSVSDVVAEFVGRLIEFAAPVRQSSRSKSIRQSPRDRQRQRDALRREAEGLK
ncbi:hypothetical protein ACO1LC_14330, partial [Staphylococcus aureus]